MGARYPTGVSSQKKRNRARKRVYALVRDAWQAVRRGELMLAEKIANRAVAEGSVNPRVWVEHGRLLCAVGKDIKGERALRHAIAMAPTYGAAFAALAELEFARGQVEAAVRLQQRAVELGRERQAEFEKDLERFLAGVGGGRDVLAGEPEVVAGTGLDPDVADAPATIPTELSVGFDWGAVAESLLESGLAPLRGLIERDEAAALRVRLDDRGPDGIPLGPQRDLVDGEGDGRWCDVPAPIPEPIGSMRADLYRELVPIAADWARRTNRDPRYPREVGEFLRSCAAYDQRTSGVAYGLFAGGGNQAIEAIDRQQIRFPIAAVVALGPAPVDFELEDLRPGKKKRVRSLRIARGDAALVAWGERLVRIAGVHGLQPVGWGLSVPEQDVADAGVLLLRMHDES